jgi:outer membrane protein OmpA-like peptidoglycan-associated protein
MNAKQFTSVGLALALLALCACVSTPPRNAALENAQAAVQSAEADPNVARYSALDLEAARKDLDAAETANRNHQEDVVNQEAYLAAQKARLAEVRAAAKADDARVADGQHERDRIQLAARTREVNTAVAQRDQASEQNARLQAELEKLKATPTSRGLVLTLGDVLFDTGKAELNPGASFKLDQLAQFLSAHPDRRVQIDGFTDSVGSDAFNEALSRRRADAVKAALVVRGVDPSRIATEGYGKAFPVANNNDSGGRQLNRRVEVVIGNDGNQPIAPRG